MQLSSKDSQRRHDILTGNMWKVVWQVCLPLAVFQLISQSFRFIDLAMVAHLGVTQVSAVSFLGQLNAALASIGTGLSTGGGIIIAGLYGAGDYHNVKKQLNTLVVFGGLISVGFVLLLLVLEQPVLRFTNMSAEIIAAGRGYFRVEVIGLGVTFLNGLYIAIEKARGNSRCIFWVNMLLIAVKLGLNFLFIYRLSYGITMVAVAGLAANLSVLLIGCFRLRKAEDVFGLSLRDVSLRWKTLLPVIQLSLPIIAEKLAFSAGKVIVSSMGASYGSVYVGALGVSNNISSFSTTPPNSICDGGAAIIRQNIGNDNSDRALDAFRKIFWLNLLVGVGGVLLTNLFLAQIVRLFAKGDLFFAQQILVIFRYERVSNVFLAVTASVMSLLYALGYTKISFVLNFLRLFVFRIPILSLLQHFTSMQGEALGLVMMISNGLTGIFALVVAARILPERFGVSFFRWRSSQRLHS